MIFLLQSSAAPPLQATSQANIRSFLAHYPLEMFMSLSELGVKLKKKKWLISMDKQTSAGTLTPHSHPKPSDASSH